MKQPLSLLVGLFILCSSIYPKVIIWDIGGVLLDSSKLSMGRSVGLSHFLGYMVFDWKSPHIEPLLFDIFDGMKCPKLPESVRACARDGVPLPAILCHWQAGTLSGEKIKKQAKRHIRRLAKMGYFVSIREQRLVERTIEEMFDPESLADAIMPINSGIRLLKDCAHAVNFNGTPRNTLIALSNWDPHSFPLVKERYRDVFDHFNEILISGNTGLIKPRRATYENLIKTYKLDPQDCLVIDDQDCNLEAAEQLGFETFLVSRGNFRQLRRVLTECGALTTSLSRVAY